MKSKLLLAVAGLGAMLAPPAQAAFINGSISFADGFDVVPSPPDTTCIVNCGTDNYDINNIVNVYVPGSANVDFAGTMSALAADLNGGAVPFDMYTTDTGFTFRVTGYSFDSGDLLACSGGLCSDNVTYTFEGVVRHAGFEDTNFIGTWTAQGTCAGSAGECTSIPSASWSSSVVALGTPVTVPEPTTVALFGLGLLGLGALRRRKLAA